MDEFDQATTLETAKTLETRLSCALAETMVKDPDATISPRQEVSVGARAAIEVLRAIAGGTDAKLSFERTLGEGGMGIVRLATQTTLGRHVAVKTVRGGPGDLSATVRILREAWVTGALEHPNVVPVYDVGLDASGAPVIVMKRIEGRHWGELIQEPTRIAQMYDTTDSLEWNIDIFVSVCNAMSFAHSRGILHRDLKPENVMIGSFGEVYVLDWGIAVSLRDDPSGRLPPVGLATEPAGTPSYMAPEMLSGDPADLSERTDVYLLGAIFYEIFTGRPPHQGSTIEELIASIMVSRPEYPEGFPPEAARICRKALAKAPEDRFQSVEELRLAVESYMRHRGSRRIAWEAKQSLIRLLDTLQNEPPGEERALAVFNLLGECRFGYRAALAAWPENTVARQGLDRALLAVVEHEIEAGDPSAAMTLLREVESAPPGVASRVEAAQRARAEEDERLRRLNNDLDPAIGSRTRTAIGSIFGVLWTVTPLLAVAGVGVNHATTIVMSALFLALGIALRYWARDSLTKTLLNRRLAATLGIQLCAQMVLSVGMTLAGMSPAQCHQILLFTWALILSYLAIWVERCFWVPAAVDAVAFLLASRFPILIYPMMSLANLVLTLLIVRVWLPKQTLERIQERRAEFRRRARRLFLEGRTDAFARSPRIDEE